MSKILTFSELKKKVDKDSSLLDATSLFNNKYGTIDTGNHMLNALLSASLTGGYPENRIISLSGEKGTGKTFLCLNGVREFQKAGYAVKFYDSEGAVSKGLVETFGVDTSDDVWDYKLISTIEEFRSDITNTAQMLIDAKRSGHEIPKMLFILDSAGNLASEKEVADALAGNNKVDMTRAKILKSVFRILTAKLAEIEATLIFTNHIYKTTDLFARSVASGGSGPAYAASIIIFLRKAQLKEGTSKNGIIVTAKTEKNRFARPEEIKFHIHYKKGMNKYVGLHEYLSWDNCGIENGKIIDHVEFIKLKDKYGAKQSDVIDTIESNAYEIGKDTFYFLNVFSMKKLKISGVKLFAIKHLAESVDATELFTERVFNKDVLDHLDKTIIKEKFSYGVSNADSFEEVFQIEEDKKEEED